MPTLNIQECVTTVLNSLLQHAATKKLGPTRTSRLFYLWFFTICSAYRWVTTSSPIQSVKDGWDWSEAYPLQSDFEVCVFVHHAMHDIMPTFISGYDTSTLQRIEDEAFGWNVFNKIYGKQHILFEGKYNLWKSKWQTWYASRQSDGSIEAIIPPTAADLPNGSQFLVVNQTINPSTFPHPNSWTPLEFGSTKQKYLTYNWGNISSSCLTKEDETNCFLSANIHYPNEATRKAEIIEIVSITNTLTELQKCEAEFWAGGAKTVSPPGMFIYFWKQFIFLQDPSLHNLFYSGLELSIMLFEVGRLVWALKKEHMQCRPIQDIRRLYRDMPMKKYDGTDILGKQWVPYQETDFVTPPFADFPSGHSAFSQSFANVMSKWFGESVPVTSINHVHDLKLICPSLKVQSECFGVFIFQKDTSEIQENIPASTITLRWNTWQEMADSAGISRKYGGIHATSAHTGSQALANELFDIVQKRLFV
jgi:membrane-associated phospholipid phosphatase